MKHRFILKKIVFEKNSWRKLSGLEIPVFPRLTAIAGHNGIGKSSILGFIANASGMSAKDLADIKSYFGTDFSSKFVEQFKLAPADITAGGKDNGYILLTYDVNKGEVVKACNIGKTQTKIPGTIRYRVVPRTKSDADFAANMGVKPDGKIPMPTIFVSAARMWPIGESPKVDVLMSSLDKDDADFLKKFHGHIIPGEVVDASPSELDLGLSRSHVLRTQHPTYKYDTTAISLGQGALASIATALASFRMLKRKMGKNYTGGILVIDEIEAGLHPRAQIKLAEQLFSVGRKLSLQIVVTTHSLVFLEEVDKRKKGKESIDGIVYIMDTKSPCVKQLSLGEMYDEMRLSPTAFAKIKKPVVTVYTEDEEAKFVLNQIIRYPDSGIDEKKLQIKVQKVSLGIGCNQIKILAGKKQAVHLGKQAVFVFDGDVQPEKLQKLDNSVSLPTEAGVLRSPEEEIRYFLSKASKDEDAIGLERKALTKNNISWDRVVSILQDIEDSTNGNKDGEKTRVILKKWFNKIPVETKKKIVMAWMETHKKAIKIFGEKYQEAIARAKNNSI